MTPDAGRYEDAEPGQDYTRLPPTVRMDDVVASVDPASPPDPEAGRNPEQHRALRDD